MRTNGKEEKRRRCNEDSRQRFAKRRVEVIVEQLEFENRDEANVHRNSWKRKSKQISQSKREERK